LVEPIVEFINELFKSLVTIVLKIVLKN